MTISPDHSYKDMKTCEERTGSSDRLGLPGPSRVAQFVRLFHHSLSVNVDTLRHSLSRDPSARSTSSSLSRNPLIILLPPHSCGIGAARGGLGAYRGGQRSWVILPASFGRDPRTVGPQPNGMCDPWMVGWRSAVRSGCSAAPQERPVWAVILESVVSALVCACAGCALHVRPSSFLFSKHCTERLFGSGEVQAPLQGSHNPPSHTYGAGRCQAPRTKK